MSTLTDVQECTRTFRIRSFDPETREFEGIAVPWDTPAPISDWDGSYREQFARGAVELPASGKVLVCWRHDEPIGRVTTYSDADEGWKIRGKISKTPTGDTAYTLLRDEVVDELSIRFIPVDQTEERASDGSLTITRTKAIVREVSLVPFGAYGPDATVTKVRSTTTALGRSTPMPTLEDTDADQLRAEQTAQREDIDQVRADFDDLVRRMDTWMQRNEQDDAATTGDTRSAGEFLRALASGDEETTRSYNELMEHLYDERWSRAYTGGTTADGVTLPGWVGDLTRIFDSTSGVLAQIFTQGTLPEQGMTIDFAELKSNTIVVNEQAAQGDDLAFGKVQIQTRNAPVKTYGGYTQLSIQEIKRLPVNMLNRSLEALGQAAGARKKAVMRTAYDALVTANTAIAADAGVVKLGAVLGASTADNWENALIDAAIKYDSIDLAPEALVVSATVFKKLRSLTVAGERVFVTYEKNASGSLNLPGLKGNLAGLPVFLDPGQAGDAANFVNGRAIRQYDSALASLQDENIVNLSKTFSVYRFGAVAAEIPQALVPLKLAA